MGRTKGSKNKINEKLEEIVEEVQALDVSEEEKAQALKELDDLFVVEPKKFIGYHPITGIGLWE
jgi:hypothetical protein